MRASGVVIRNLTVVGGEYGIDVSAREGSGSRAFASSGQKLDGIHVRFSQIMIRDCTVAVSGPYTQGIDISYSGFQGMGAVEGCDVSGGDEGIVVHASNITVSGNRVHGTGMRAITMSEMSMGEIDKNNVSGSVGVGVYCGDHSMCEVNQNVDRRHALRPHGQRGGCRRRDRGELLRRGRARPQRAGGQSEARRIVRPEPAQPGRWLGVVQGVLTPWRAVAPDRWAYRRVFA